MDDDSAHAPAARRTSSSGSETQVEVATRTNAVEMASFGDAKEQKSELDPETGGQSLDRTPLNDNESQHVTGFKLATVVVSLLLAVFCVAIDNTIIATAIPRITDDFHTVADVGWYGSAYLLTTCAFQLLYARLYTIFNVKTVFLAALLMFEVGSVICGAAPSSTVLIVGRAVAGIGAAGLFTGATTAVAQVAPIEKRPMIIGLLGGLFGISSIIGPLLGGLLTVRATWRWCFYINLPIGAVAAAGTLAFLHVKRKLATVEGGVVAWFSLFDPIGNTFFISAEICLLLALEWGGTTYAWSNGKVVALFVVFGVLFLAFIGVELWQGESATIPSRVARQRTIRFGALFALCIGSTVFIMVYFLPIWFQAIRGDSPVMSAVHMLPLILAQVLGVIFAGAMTSRIGYYMPFVWASIIFMPIGIGLMTTFDVDISEGKWIGYQIPFGLGMGFGFQQVTIAAQVVLPLPDIPIGVAVVFSAQFLGGAVFVSVAENVFTNHLTANLAALNIPDFDPMLAVKAGATELRTLVPPLYLSEVLGAYNDAITKAFQVALIMSCLCVLGAVGMEWRQMKKAGQPSQVVAETTTN